MGVQQGHQFFLFACCADMALLILKHLGYEPFFTENPFSPSNECVFTGLMARMCLFDAPSGKCYPITFSHKMRAKVPKTLITILH